MYDSPTVVEFVEYTGNGIICLPTFFGWGGGGGGGRGEGEGDYGGGGVVS